MLLCRHTSHEFAINKRRQPLLHSNELRPPVLQTFEFDLPAALKIYPAHSTLKVLIGAVKMESSLKRIVDYKLLYDSLADPSNGMIQLATLTTRWPKDLAASMKLPRSLPEKWRAAADDNGYLDWERFSSAMKKALEEDKPRLLSKTDGSQTPPTFGAEGKMSSFQQRNKGAQAPRVRAEEIEMFLSSCKGGILAQALSRTRKEVYKCQMSLHQLESASNRAAAAANSSGNGAQPKQSDPSSTSVKVLNNIMYQTLMKVEPVYVQQRAV